MDLDELIRRLRTEISRYDRAFGTGRTRAQHAPGDAWWQWAADRQQEHKDEIERLVLAFVSAERGEE